MEYCTLKQGLSQEEMFEDLDMVVRAKVHGLIKTVLEEEVAEFIQRHKGKILDNGKHAIVRNGYHKEREITCCSGKVSVKVPRTRDRSGEGETFSSILIPRYMRRSLKIDEAIPVLYLHGISTRDMLPALEKLFGEGIKGFSPGTITRLKKVWQDEYTEWKRRDLSESRYCYIWIDGIYVNVRFSTERLCLLVAIGAREDGKKELIAVESGYRESTESWSMMLRDLKARGMRPPSLFIGDGNLGIWKAIRNVYPQSNGQRCWVHKISNVLDKLPKSVQGKAKGMLHEIYNAPDKDTANKAFDRFIEVFEDKYSKATDCLEKDREHLLQFYSYPARHWKHIRTTNPIESTFSTVRLRTKKTRGQGTEATTLLMVYKLIEKASKRWQKINAVSLIPKVIKGVIFVDGREPGELKDVA